MIEDYSVAYVAATSEAHRTNLGKRVDNFSKSNPYVLEYATPTAARIIAALTCDTIIEQARAHDTKKVNDWVLAIEDAFLSPNLKK